MTTIEQEYARLKALADAATSAPWTMSAKDLGTFCLAEVERYGIYSTHDELGGKGAGRPEADARFIASAHDMMALIERLMQAANSNREWLEKTEWMYKIGGPFDDPKYLGWHRADALKDAFEQLMRERMPEDAHVPAREAGPSAFGGRKTDRSRT